MNALDSNCLAFRREKLADPSRLSEAARTHLAGCPLCQTFARRVDQNEQKIARALDVPVPEGLNDRLMLTLRERRAKPWRAWALAATVVASFGAGLLTFHRHGEYDPARFAIEHVMHEPEALSTERLASADEFRAVVAHFGGQLEGELGQVRYMKLCPGPEGAGWHVVLDTDHGLVSLFLIPGDRIKLPAQKSMNGYTALALPGGLGYYAIVSPDEATIAAFAHEMRQKVHWRISVHDSNRS